MRATGKTWLIVGSSPSAPRFFDQLLRTSDVWMTSNSGWQLFLTCDEFHGLDAARLKYNIVLPDYYWLSDGHGCELHARAMKFMQCRGTKIVTMIRSYGGIEARGLQNADRLVALPDRDEYEPYLAGRYVHSRFSGTICAQFALAHGADRLLLVGMEGYRSGPGAGGIVQDTFDGRMGKPSGELATRNWIGPFMQSMVDACPGVQFVFFGKLRYPIAGPNVTIVKKPEDI